MRITPAFAVISALCVALTCGYGATSAPASPRLAAGESIPTDESFQPTAPLGETHLVATTRVGTKVEGRIVMHWRGPERYRAIEGLTRNDIGVHEWQAGRARSGFGVVGALEDGAARANVNNVGPDALDQFTSDLMGVVLPLIARQRAGESRFTWAKLGGRDVLRARLALTPDSCATSASGSRTIDMDPATFLPMRIVVARTGTPTRTTTILRRAATADDFTPIVFKGSPQRFDDGFMRMTPAKADAATFIPFAISMPSFVPAGFQLRSTGAAKQGEELRAVRPMPRSAGLYAARWTRGAEAIELTIRGTKASLGTDWEDRDPFEGQCGPSETGTIVVGGHDARFGRVEDGAPYIWWRDGSTLYSLSGPVAVTTLASIGASLEPIASAGAPI